MTNQKHSTPEKILWIDLEMTGLEPSRDRIVETAAIVTDWDFNELASYQSGVGHQKGLVKKLFQANPWALARPQNTEELITLSENSPTEKQVESEVLNLINGHFKPDEPALLAGNSIHCDRGFIKQWWPRVEQRLHYRMLDVSAWKVVMQGKYGLEFTKKEEHRAIDDIRESIEELKFYLKKAQL